MKHTIYFLGNTELELFVLHDVVEIKVYRELKQSNTEIYNQNFFLFYLHCGVPVPVKYYHVAFMHQWLDLIEASLRTLCGSCFPILRWNEGKKE